MPYPGMDEDDVPKMDRCVEKVMKRGHTKSEAIAICRASMKKTHAGFFCVKTGTDEYRWVSFANNRWRDRDTRNHPQGEIITESAHKDFVKWVDQNPSKMPQWWTWHTKGTARSHRADVVDYVNGFLIVSGPCDLKEAAPYLIDDPKSPIGTSIGFYALERNRKEGLILKYRAFEVSDLPVDAAANPWTPFSVHMKELLEMDKFSPKKREYLVSKLGEQKVAEIEAQSDDMAKALEAAGIDSKEFEAIKEDTPNTTPDSVPQIDSTAAQLIVKSIVEQLNPEGLKQVMDQVQKDIVELKKAVEDVAALKTAVEELQKSSDQKLADLIRPRSGPISWGYQPSSAKDNVVDPKDPKDKDLDGAQPELEWIKSTIPPMA